jgi:DNA-binding NarL/FixJ family response regulator
MLSVLVVEDDEQELEKFKTYVSESKRKSDIELVGITNSDMEGLKIAKKSRPEIIILDLYLDSGVGNQKSTFFIRNLRKQVPDYDPVIIGNTSYSNDLCLEILKHDGLATIFHKTSENHSMKEIFAHAKVLHEHKQAVRAFKTENQENDEVDTKDPVELINLELDKIGIGHHLVGRQYIVDAVVFLVDYKGRKVSCIKQLVKKHKKAHNTISQNITQAIMYAFSSQPLPVLQRCYKAPIRYDTGIPTPNEFLFYYADKIRELLGK